MEMPGEDTPAEAYLSKSAYTIARVAADPKVAALEKGVETSHAQLKKALRDREDLQESVQRKMAVLDAADTGCDDDIGGFELGLLGLVQKNREAPKYRRYFAYGLREVTTAEPRQEEPELVRQMLIAMDEDKADSDLGPLVAVWSPKLTASRNKVIAADEDLTTLEKDLAFLTDKTIPSLMAAWRTEYKKLEGALTTAYADNPKKVDRFFKPFRKRRKDKKQPEGPSTPAPTDT
jgi:hypothetical protein